MWWSETRTTGRRAVLLGALAALAACGFQPVYGPDVGGQQLIGAVVLSDAADPDRHRFNRRFEERMGRPEDEALYALDVSLDTRKQGLGSTSAGATTRERLLGTARYVLRDAATGEQVQSGSTNAFTGYSTTGSTPATQAAERDAQERLMVLLADQVIDLLLISARDFA